MFAASDSRAALLKTCLHGPPGPSRSSRHRPSPVRGSGIVVTRRSRRSPQPANRHHKRRTRPTSSPRPAVLDLQEDPEHGGIGLVSELALHVATGRAGASRNGCRATRSAPCRTARHS
jgi:hypothetical protein